MKKMIILTCSIISILCIYQVFYFILDNALVWPSIFKVLNTFFSLFTNTGHYFVFGCTLFRLIIAVIASVLLGAFLGIIGGLYRNFEIFITPYVQIFRTIPFVAIIMIVLVLAGYDKTPYLITILILFPIMYQACLEGVKSIDKDLIDILKIDAPTKVKVIFKIYIPLIYTYIKTSMIQMIGLGFKVIVTSEFLSQTNDSIGKKIVISINNVKYDEVMAWSILIIIFSIILQKILICIKNKINND